MHDSRGKAWGGRKRAHGAPLMVVKVIGSGGLAADQGAAWTPSGVGRKGTGR